MKKCYALLVLSVVTLSLWWLLLRSPAHDPHYDAAACAAVDMLGAPVSQQDFADKIRTVIINENSSYSLRQVSYDDKLGQVSIARYQTMSAREKEVADQDIASCIRVMAASAG